MTTTEHSESSQLTRQSNAQKVVTPNTQSARPSGLSGGCSESELCPAGLVSQAGTYLFFRSERRPKAGVSRCSVRLTAASGRLGCAVQHNFKFLLTYCYTIGTSFFIKPSIWCYVAYVICYITFTLLLHTSTYNVLYIMLLLKYIISYVAYLYQLFLMYMYCVHFGYI